MGRGNEVNVMTSILLELQHDVSKRFKRDLTAFTQVAYRPVLAEEAAEVAVRKEDRTGAVPADQRTFFPEVRVIT
jgi:hypothetical protein